jgi:hypothetical protein
MGRCRRATLIICPLRCWRLGGPAAHSWQRKWESPGFQIPPPSAIRDQRQKFLGEKKNTFEMNIDELVEQLLQGPLERRIEPDACVVHQSKQPLVPHVAQFTSQCRRERAEGSYVARIQLERTRRAPQNLDFLHDRGRRGVLSLIGDHDIEATLGKSDGTVLRPKPRLAPITRAAFSDDIQDSFYPGGSYLKGGSVERLQHAEGVRVHG